LDRLQLPFRRTKFVRLSTVTALLRVATAQHAGMLRATRHGWRQPPSPQRLPYKTGGVTRCYSAVSASVCVTLCLPACCCWLPPTYHSLAYAFTYIAILTTMLPAASSLPRHLLPASLLPFVCPMRRQPLPTCKRRVDAHRATVPRYDAALVGVSHPLTSLEPSRTFPVRAFVLRGTCAHRRHRIRRSSASGRH